MLLWLCVRGFQVPLRPCFRRARVIPVYPRRWRHAGSLCRFYIGDSHTTGLVLSWVCRFASCRAFARS
jgi:hypothetical protein